MSIIYDLLQAYAEQTALVSQATNKIEAQKKDIAHLLKHNSILEDELYKLRDEARELNERVECEGENAGKWRAEYEKAQSNYLRVVRHQDGQTQEISDLQDENARLLVALDRLRTKNEDLQADNAAKAAYILSGKHPITDYYRTRGDRFEAELKAIHEKAKRRNDRKKEQARRKKLKDTLSKEYPEPPLLHSSIVHLFYLWKTLQAQGWTPDFNYYRLRIDAWKEAHRVKTP